MTADASAPDNEFETFSDLPKSHSFRGRKGKWVERLNQIAANTESGEWVVLEEYDTSAEASTQARLVRNNDATYAGWDAAGRTVDGRHLALVRRIPANEDTAD